MSETRAAAQRRASRGEADLKRLRADLLELADELHKQPGAERIVPRLRALAGAPAETWEAHPGEAQSAALPDIVGDHFACGNERYYGVFP